MSMPIGPVMIKPSGSPIGTLSLLRRTLPRPHVARIYLSQMVWGRCGRVKNLGVGSFEPAMVVIIEPDVVIVSEIAVNPSSPLPKNSVDVVGPSTPPKVDVAGLSTPSKDLVDVAKPLEVPSPLPPPPPTN